MLDKKIKMSVIIPVYNVEKYLRPCLDSVVNQTIDKEELQVILINDGSTDSSGQICAEYANKYNFFEIYNKENGGLSKARNTGLSVARGKYIAFLDSDDRLSAETLKNISDFFDQHYDEVDLVTYKIVPIMKGIRKKEHYRYKTLNKTGVYDLNNTENYYITQTNINIVIKNKGNENVLFDVTPNYKHEDQLFCTIVLKEKMKIGYVTGCEYLYEQNPFGATSGFFSTVTFDVTNKKWYELFEKFDGRIPPYVQALYVNDIQWKLKSDIFLPYHLEGEDYDKAIEMIRGLLSQIDDSIILNHPDCDEMSKYYFINLKYNYDLNVLLNDRMILLNKDNIIFSSDSVKLTVTRFKFKNNVLEVGGHLSSPVFQYTEKPKLILSKKGEADENLEVFESSFCYDGAKIKNNLSWGFNVCICTESDVSFSFSIELNGRIYPVELLTGEWIAFNKDIDRNEYVINNKYCKMTVAGFTIRNVSCREENKYYIKRLLYYLKNNLKVFLVRLLCFIFFHKDEIWLYHDCENVGKDNAFQQYIYDFSQNDDIKRYYVVNGDVSKVKDLFTPEQQKYLISFRSWKHKLFYLKASKIITAFIEKVNYLPFFDDVYMHYIDLFKGDVIYLQHGVLHAHLPWKYSYERLDVSAEVVSSYYEVENFTHNYSFPERALIKSKMPRYDFVDCFKTPQCNRILFAPSWRKYLIKLSGDGKWFPIREKFLESDYYKKTLEFLTSEDLTELLETNNWYLDVKLHPIFTVYNDCFEFNNPRISFVKDTDVNDYKVLITDYSSFVFDFVYLGRSVIYFMPDYKEFKCGFNDYKELDIPFENGFGEFTQNAPEAVLALERIIKNDGMSIPPFDKKSDKFFFDKSKNCREKIYNAVKNI